MKTLDEIKSIKKDSDECIEEFVKREKNRKQQILDNLNSSDSSSDSLDDFSDDFMEEERDIKKCPLKYYDKMSSFMKKQKFVGTAEYMAPEVIKEEEVGIYTDLWSFGCLVYECFTGKSPFLDKTEYLIFQNILNLKYEIDRSCIPSDAEDLITSLLKINPKERLGSGLTEDNKLDKLKSHKFFMNFNLKKYFKIIETYNNKNNQRESIFEKKNKTLFHSQKIELENNHSDEKILKIGILKMRSSWMFSKKLKVILYETPRIDCLHPNSNYLIESIMLNKDISVTLIDKKTFILKINNYNKNRQSSRKGSRKGSTNKGSDENERNSSISTNGTNGTNISQPTRTKRYKFKCKKQYEILSWVTQINDSLINYSH